GEYAAAEHKHIAELANGLGFDHVWFAGNESFVGNYGTGNSPAPTDPTSPLAANTSYDYSIPLTVNDCYTFTIYDYYGDGVGASQWGGSNVDGNLTLMDQTNTVLYTLSAADFGAQVSDVVKNTDNSGLQELDVLQWKLFPNPTTDMLHVSVQYGQATEWVVTDVFGKTILRQHISGNEVQLNTENLSNGTYFVKVHFVNGSRSVKSFVKR
ncbi:MAG: T9SS type A sorting domain-containing protein, partial [Flavobacteriales bacterium]